MTKCDWCRCEENDSVFQINGWPKRFFRVCSSCSDDMWTHLDLCEYGLDWLRVDAEGKRHVCEKRSDFQTSDCQVGVYWDTPYRPGNVALLDAWLGRNREWKEEDFEKACGEMIRIGWRDCITCLELRHISWQDTMKQIKAFIQLHNLSDKPWQPVCDRYEISRDCFGLEKDHLSLFCFPGANDAICLFDSVKEMNRDLKYMYSSDADMQEWLYWDPKQSMIDHLSSVIDRKRKKLDQMDTACKALKTCSPSV